MRKSVFSVALCAAVTLGAGLAFAQGTEDAEGGGGGGFPLAAAAGTDSGAVNKAPANAVNQGPFNPDTWKYGKSYDPPAGSKIWNPVKIKLDAGQKVVGGTVFYDYTPQVYCAMANAGYDFTWTEMQHDARSWQDVANMWATCPHARAVPGTRIAYENEREEQHALDEGAMVLIIPTVRSEAEGIRARNWAFFPPLGHRSSGGGPAFLPEFWGSVPGGYRNTVNDNLVLVEMIETLEGLRDVDKIAKIKGVSAIFAASGDIGNHTGYRRGDPDYEREINMVHDAAIRNHIRLCGPFAWRDRPDFTCFQGGTEVANIQRGAKAELGALWNTQGKPEVGPYAGLYPATPARGR